MMHMVISHKWQIYFIYNCNCYFFYTVKPCFQFFFPSLILRYKLKASELAFFLDTLFSAI